MLFYVLKGLIPYTRENMLLSFRPGRYFDELEEVSGYPKQTIKTAYYRAKKSGYIEKGTSSRLTNLGNQKLQPFLAKKLRGGGKLMVIFDIPREHNGLRRQFRALLKEWGFIKIQQSVWATSFDHVESVRTAVDELGLQDYVQLYEAAKL